jgi:hypothetical protein
MKKEGVGERGEVEKDETDSEKKKKEEERRRKKKKEEGGLRSRLR